MDQMLPSPYNIPGIDTPLHQPEEDQQILPNAMQQQHQHQQQQQQHALAAMGSSPLVGFGASLMGTPQRSVHTYAPAASYATPQQMMQPQTPVITFVNLLRMHNMNIHKYFNIRSLLVNSV